MTLARARENLLVALDTLADLDEHCYMAAGCVGEYWTVMTAAQRAFCSITTCCLRETIFEIPRG